MDEPTTGKSAKINRWLPYWAVLQADLHLTLRSWVYRAWLLILVVGAVGYLLSRISVYREAGIVQSASVLLSELLRWSVVGSATLVLVLTGGSISAERGTMADSVLSRGISRYQYFLGKWHARLLAVLGTYLFMGLAVVVGGLFFLHVDLSVAGCLVALATILAVLTAIATCGVSVSAVANSTMLGIAVLLITLYGAGFGLSLLPEGYQTPDRLLNNLPNVLRGMYDLVLFARVIGASLLGSVVIALVGMVYFSRRDV